MKAQQARMNRAVSYLTAYMATYHKQPGYLEYTDETFINDVLYGLGVALDGHEYFAAQGFDKFKARLLEHLEADRAWVDQQGEGSDRRCNPWEHDWSPAPHNQCRKCGATPPVAEGAT